MANFKNKRPRSGRAGCGMCKSHKKGWINPDKEIGNNGFVNIKRLQAGNDDYNDWMNMEEKEQDFD